MVIRIAERTMKLHLNKDYYSISTDGGNTYYRTYSLIKNGSCVDIIDDFDDSVWTVKIKDITHINLNGVAYEVVR